MCCSKFEGWYCCVGGFIKYYNLKVYDGFVVYEDGSGKLVSYFFIYILFLSFVFI